MLGEKKALIADWIAGHTTMRRSALLATAGAALAIASTPFVIEYIKDISAAAKMDEYNRLEAAGPCSHPLRDVVPDRRVLIVGESMNITVTVFNYPKLRSFIIGDVPDNLDITKNNYVIIKPHKCKVHIEINAAAFEVSPKERILTIPLGTTKIYFNVSPKTPGTQLINVFAGLDDKTIGVTVKNQYFLNMWETSILSIISAIGGPMLTIPWWIEFVRNRKKKNNGICAPVRRSQMRPARRWFSRRR